MCKTCTLGPEIFGLEMYKSFGFFEVGRRDFFVTRVNVFYEFRKIIRPLKPILFYNQFKKIISYIKNKSMNPNGPINYYLKNFIL